MRVSIIVLRNIVAINLQIGFCPVIGLRRPKLYVCITGPLRKDERCLLLVSTTLVCTDLRVPNNMRCILSCRPLCRRKRIRIINKIFAKSARRTRFSFLSSESRPRVMIIQGPFYFSHEAFATTLTPSFWPQFSVGLWVQHGPQACGSPLPAHRGFGEGARRFLGPRRPLGLPALLRTLGTRHRRFADAPHGASLTRCSLCCPEGTPHAPLPLHGSRLGLNLSKHQLSCVKNAKYHLVGRL